MKIVIPMSGAGTRFVKAGYEEPKSLLMVDGKPIIEHIVDMFPGEDDFIFICNPEHLEKTNLREVLERIKPTGKIIEGEKHKKGPVYTVLPFLDEIGDDEQVIVNYCDFGWDWDYEDFKRKMEETKCDGCVVAYKGYHPHHFGDTYYGYMRWDENNYMLEIREKEPFTNNRQEEYASSGTYYFRKGEFLKKYFKEVVDKDINKYGEYFASLPYNPMVRDGLKVYIYEIPVFLQWGTPQDLEEYEAWSRHFLGEDKGKTSEPKGRKVDYEIKLEPGSEEYKEAEAYWAKYFEGKK
ncbi:MAG: glycosyltransferase family 2 protein [archaeon]